ncbi:Cdc6/Cdc18 family protein [Methanofollis ethanolicus]|uniref:hypothetical protein n=1 Tax=Methanofollis ethanolicus TaxID=488124 RepID=UPI000A920472|nr:hypothetical protein [Methanofollis ethanolicus]
MVPPAALDLVVRRAVACGDSRVGLGLLKEAVLHTERAGRTAAEAGDVEAAVAVARHAHLAAGVRALTPPETAVLSVLAGMARRGEETTSGRVYEAVSAIEPMSYMMFFERLERLDALHLVATRQRRKGQGRTREIVVREGVGDAVAPVPAASSGTSVKCPAGVADDEKRRYETGHE